MKWNIFHISAECYPAAKVGGLADVVGALPRYQVELGHHAAVIMPKYHLPWILEQDVAEVHYGKLVTPWREYEFWVQEVVNEDLGYHLFVIEMPGLFDRAGVYAAPPGNYFRDEPKRNILFQRAALTWIHSFEKLPHVIHCHDHHTGLIPFMMKYSFDFQRLANTPSLFTIHNGSYQGMYSWDQSVFLPSYHASMSGLLDWGHAINAFSSAIRCAHAVTTVSPSYLAELEYMPRVGHLLAEERAKCFGILNGIDSKVWNPKEDTFITNQLKRSPKTFKNKNKAYICKHMDFNEDMPLFTFIGRLAHEKGAHLLAHTIHEYLSSGGQGHFFVLGSGDGDIANGLHQLSHVHGNRVHFEEAYNEAMAHQLYAGSDYLMMPSQTEPCGLNQMYAMAYGTIPIVHGIGGLKDTVIPLDREGNGSGFVFYSLDANDIVRSLYHAAELYQDQELKLSVVKKIMKQNFSWEKSVSEYIDLYEKLNANR